eukprot:CAMPEP_0180821866 /NCGR_PEP_ID=MMETSP1038_2-20121128/71060_1 /TAXON_ID=632150 /ORGANISM="Azadinium spinosum, Strain 3D9" /LENGTH=37 /DNA_ID= /DNA_START= /DNA_END= /DNA_ORIENTATION=
MSEEQPLSFCDDDASYAEWAHSNGIEFSKLQLRRGST